jgi:NAD(P)H-dependent FMN reductase
VRITIIDGSPVRAGLSRFVADLESTLNTRSHHVQTFPLREIHLRYCFGCYDCCRSGGGCTQSDPEGRLLAAIGGSDLVLLASPIVLGSTSALLKQVLDRLAVQVQQTGALGPAQRSGGSKHPVAPPLGLLLEPQSDTRPSEIEAVITAQQPHALRLGTALAFVRVTSDRPDHVAAAIDGLARIAG